MRNNFQFCLWNLISLEYCRYKNDASQLKNFCVWNCRLFPSPTRLGKKGGNFKAKKFFNWLASLYWLYFSSCKNLWISLSFFLFIHWQSWFSKSSGEAILIANTIFLKKKSQFLMKNTKKNFRYSGVGKISKITLFCRVLLHNKVFIRKLCAIGEFCAKLKVVIVGFY